MNKQDIEAYIVELDEALANAFPSPEPISVLVVGGACLLLSDVTKRITKDIDVVITDLEGTGEATLVYRLTKTTKRIRRIIANIGKSHGLPPKERMFLNDDCAMFLQAIGDLPRMRLYKAYRKLHLYLPADLGYILACKLMAGRPDKDYEDIRVLRKTLRIHTRGQAQALVNGFFPDPMDQRIHQLQRTLAEMFPEG